jgi:hypothetical protein
MVMHCRRDQRNLVVAALREIFNAEGYEQAKERITHVLRRLASVAPKVCELLEAAEEDLLAFCSFPPEHWTKLQVDATDLTRSAVPPCCVLTLQVCRWPTGWPEFVARVLHCSGCLGR